jgi:hypothetical protein
MHALYPAATIANVGSISTFSTDTTHQSADLLRLGGSIAAQGGSSCGAVISQDGGLLGIIVTSTRSKTTAERDLSAITTLHIDNTLMQDIGISMSQLISLPVNVIKDLAVNSIQNSAKILINNLNN